MGLDFYFGLDVPVLCPVDFVTFVLVLLRTVAVYVKTVLVKIALVVWIIYITSFVSRARWRGLLGSEFRRQAISPCFRFPCPGWKDFICISIGIVPVSWRTPSRALGGPRGDARPFSLFSFPAPPIESYLYRFRSGVVADPLACARGSARGCWS